MVGQAVDLGTVVSQVLAWLNLYLALPVAIVGFALAIWQIRLALGASRQALTAAQSADRASRETAISIRRNLKTNQLHWLSDTGTRLERELSALSRAERPEPQTVVDLLRSWIDSARRIRANLEAEDAVLKQAIDASIDACAKARNSYSLDPFEQAARTAWEALNLVEDVLNLASSVADDVIQLEAPETETETVHAHNPPHGDAVR